MKDLIIIGAGPSGLTAALYALRAGKSVLVLEQENFGGQIANSPRVENFPSHREISGSEFADRLFEQVASFGGEIELEKVSEIQKSGEGVFSVLTDYARHDCRAVIIANGVKHRKTGVADEEKYVGKGVYYCAICDGAFYKGREVALIGDANTALQYALLLSNYCTKVHLVTMFDKFFGDGVLVEAVRKRENVEITQGYLLNAFKGEEKLSGLVFKETYGEKTFSLDVPALFVAIGQIPDNKRFENVAATDKAGYFITDADCKTRTDGVFAAGDCRAKSVRQLTTAVSDGAVAATFACAYVDSLKK